MSQDIVDACIRLMKKDEFFSNIIIQLKKIPNSKIPTIGVGFDQSGMILVYNPDFFESKPNLMQEEILIHECEHIIKGHLNDMDKYSDKKQWNIACDIQINQNLKTLQEYHTPEKHKLDRNLLSVQYYDLLEKNKDPNKNNNGKCSNGEDLDSHEFWDEVPKELKDAFVKNTIEKAMEQTKAGSIPNGAYELIERINARNQLPSRKMVRRYIGKLLSFDLKTTRRKKNKRYGYQYAGKKIHNNKLKIGALLDTSASVSSQYLSKAFVEVDHLNSLGHQITLLECDADVQEIKQYKRKMPLKVKGRGGTQYQPALDKAKEMGFDLIFFFGDGGCFDNPQDTGIPTIWVLGKDDPVPANFGMIYRIDE